MRLASGIFLVALCVASPLRAGDVLDGLRPGHPRLIVTDEAFAKAREAERTDPLRTQLDRQIVTTAEQLLSAPPIEYVLVGPRLLDQSRHALAHVLTCAMAYRLTGDVRFADHARDTMLRAARFPDWNPSHFLDVAEMATALGLGYDWLYPRLTSDERAIIRRALVEKALAYAPYAYGRRDPQRESFPFVKGNLRNNWNQVCNGGFVIAALAVAEDEPELAREVIAGLRQTLPYALEAYRPDGAYPEGPTYWNYGTHYNVLILAALESALGRDFGLGDFPPFAATVRFRFYVQSPTGLTFNYADSKASAAPDPAVAWLAQRYRLPVVEKFARGELVRMLEAGAGQFDGFLALHVAWFPRDTPPDASLPLDVKFEGESKVALFRSDWSASAIWTGLKAGSDHVNHGHLDLGAFMFDAEGERWAVDLGPDDYNLPGYWDGASPTGQRWRYYRLNNFSHNTLTLGETLQEPAANAPFVSFGSTPQRAFAVADLTSANPGRVVKHRRGLALLERRRVLVQDDLAGVARGTSVTWRMLTSASVKLDGAHATLTQNGKTVQLDLLAPQGAVFATRPAMPATAAGSRNEGVTDLYVERAGSSAERSDLRIAVLLTPMTKDAQAAATLRLTPLEEWK